MNVPGVAGVDLEVLRRGTGRPVLVLHGFSPVPPDAPFVAALAEHAEVIAPSHPAFGGSPRPPDFDSIYDLVHLYTHPATVQRRSWHDLRARPVTRETRD